jgi:hypothetical protein
MDRFCHICFTKNIDENLICDRCDNYYCEDCSYTFSLHYQFQGSRCYSCAEQNRLKSLSKNLIRDNKLLILFNI